MAEPGPTTPEVQAAIEAFMQIWKERTARNECFQCGTPLTAQRQIGRCIYAEPCGCRLGQGRLTTPEGKRVSRITFRQEDV